MVTFMTTTARLTLALGIAALVPSLLLARSSRSATPADSPVISAAHGEVGRPFLNCIGSRDYKATSQNWVFAEDNRGLIYVGNNLGVLEYDGSSWRLIETINRSVVRAMTKDDQGRLYIGSTGEIGYLAPDARGQLQYVSLLEHVPQKDRDFNDVWTAHATPQGIYFQSREILFRLTPPCRPREQHWLEGPELEAEGPLPVRLLDRRRLLRPPPGRRAPAHGGRRAADDSRQ